MCEGRQTPARLAEVLHKHEPTALASEMASTMLFALSILAISSWTWMASPLADGSPTAPTSPWSSLLVLLLVIAPLFIVASVWLPWSITRLGASRYIYHTWPLWR